MRFLFALLTLASAPGLAQQKPIELKGLNPPPKQKPVELTPPAELEKKIRENEPRIFFFPQLPLKTTPAYSVWLTFVTQSDLFKASIDKANGLVKPKRAMPVHFKECGKPSAFFDRETGHITVCSEFVELVDVVQARKSKTADETRKAVEGAMYFVFFHELGHALIHELELPVTGREEDVADQFATLMLLENGREGMQAVLEGALFFLGLGELKKGELAFWDEHSLDKQRFFNLACWVYGASPFANVNMVAKGILPVDRAAKCGQEFEQLHRAWKTIAEPKLKRPFQVKAPK